MNDDAIRNIFAKCLAQSAVIDALIATHPDPAGLLRAIQHHSEPMIVGLLNTQVPEATRDRTEVELNAFRLLAEKHGQAQRKGILPS